MFISLLLTSLGKSWSIFHYKISPQTFLRYKKSDHFASKLTRITIFKEIQTLIVDCTIDQFGFECAKRSVINGPLKVRLLQRYKVLWIHNIDAVCTSALQCIKDAEIKGIMVKNTLKYLAI